jgi:hypothetical protein
MTLGKPLLCRVPDELHQAKCATLGKERISGSYYVDFLIWQVNETTFKIISGII